MTWYAAHLLEYFKLREGTQDEFLVFENVVLIQADTAEQAFERAEEIGKGYEVDDPSQTLNDKPSYTVFGGVRKLIECIDLIEENSVERPGHGTEITYSRLEVGAENLQALLDDDTVDVNYIGEGE